MLVLTLAAEEPDAVERARIDALLELIEAALAHPELTSRSASNTVEQRRNAAARLADDPRVKQRLAIAPRAYVLAQTPEALARQAALCEPAVTGDEVRAGVVADGPSQWRIEAVAADRIGLLSRVASAMNGLGFDIVDAVVCTWPDGTALTSFGVRRAEPPLASEVEDRVHATLRAELSSEPVEDATVTFDDEASPWHTICQVETRDRPGLLSAVTAAFATAGSSVHSARVTTHGASVADTFEMTDDRGAKLDLAHQARITELIRSGVRPERRRRRFARRT